MFNIYYYYFRCPWQPNVICSGGGTADRCIRIWNSNNGSLMNTVDTKSQVCSLVFAPEYKELVSAHGYAHNQVTIWKYPTMVSIGFLFNKSYIFINNSILSYRPKLLNCLDTPKESYICQFPLMQLLS